MRSFCWTFLQYYSFQQKLQQQNHIVCMFPVKKIPNTSIKDENVKRSRQQLIIQINIGKQIKGGQIRLRDISNMNYIDFQVKEFMKTHHLKQTAFAFIKQIIINKIKERREEIFQESHSKRSKNCKCGNKIHQFQEKQKKILGVISLNEPAKIERKSQRKAQKQGVQRLSIQITPAKSTNNKQSHPIFVFNSSFTLPSQTGEKQIIFLADDRYHDKFQPALKQQAYFYNTSQFKSRQSKPKKKHFHLKQERQYRGLSASQAKSSDQKYSQNLTVQSLQRNKNQNTFSTRQSHGLSTKQRKQAIMTTKKQKSFKKPLRIKTQNLQPMPTQQNSFKESNTILPKILQSPLFPQGCFSKDLEDIMENIFKKLIIKNPPEVKELKSQYISYQLLEKEELQMMSTFFQKIDHTQLNHLDFSNFRSNSLKYCWNELKRLAEISQL